MNNGLPLNEIVSLRDFSIGMVEAPKELYPYQEEAIERLFHELDRYDESVNLLFQLPTGGGKTFIFSHIAKRYIQHRKKKVLILTHRIELCRQTSGVLDSIDLKNKVITADVKTLPDQDEFMCFTAMVETLNNRLKEDENFIKDIGMVIVDEAHYNSFRKIFQYFNGVNILGVTATPLSSNRNLPLNENYDHLVVGKSIRSLIDAQYLSKGTTFTYDVNLKGLKVGIHGDYTISSIERVYTQAFMQQKLVQAYQEVAEGSKTLIFNAGIVTSRGVEKVFDKAGYPVKHLDSTFTKEDRKAVLKWFRETKGAILTSVGILTTGFDEPSVETILLNRATRSLTLYHQMIGRGSRIWDNRTNFNIIDLGNNALRLGLWDDPIDWHEVFLCPDRYLDRQLEIERKLEEKEYPYEMPMEVRQRFKKLPEEFDLKRRYRKYIEGGEKPKKVLDDSIDHHVEMIKQNAEDIDEGLELFQLLEDEIDHRIQQYKKCVNGTDNYANWLKENYQRNLRSKLFQELN